MSSAHDFEVLFKDKGHILIASQFREGIAHILNLEENGKWICSCERAVINKEHCKHLKWLRRMKYDP